MFDQNNNSRQIIQSYNFAFLDENTKREIRRAILKAIAIPGYQVPFASRELPIFYGWGTGGLQLTLSIIGKKSILKIIDQGDDDSVNAVNLRQLVQKTTGVETTEDATQATIIQTRHRIPEELLRNNQVLVYQVPLPEPLRNVEPREVITKRMHGEKDYGKLYVKLYEDILHHGEITISTNYPVMVNNRYLMSTSPIPRWDVPKLNQSSHLHLFGAGRESKIYAVPPYTSVVPLSLDDFPFRVEDFKGKSCIFCGSQDTYLNEIPCATDKDLPVQNTASGKIYACSDTSYCKKVRKRNKNLQQVQKEKNVNVKECIL